MSARPPLPPEAADQFVAGYGKSGGLGVFTADAPLRLSRGTPVVLQTPRGTELGTALGPASVRQARLLGATAAGRLLRRADDADLARRAEQQATAQALFAAGRAGAARLGSEVELLDVDLLFDGTVAILQYVGQEDAALDPLVAELERQFGVAIRLENLALPVAPEEAAGCDKPDCGRDAGGCSSCSTGGGCSSCGSSKVDMREYFAHLRGKMEADRRTPLA